MASVAINSWWFLLFVPSRSERTLPLAKMTWWHDLPGSHKNLWPLLLMLPHPSFPVILRSLYRRSQRDHWNLQSHRALYAIIPLEWFFVTGHKRVVTCIFCSSCERVNVITVSLACLELNLAMTSLSPSSFHFKDAFAALSDMMIATPSAWWLPFV